MTELSGPLRAFYEFWDSLPKADLLPQLADVLDRLPPDVAPYCIIVDVRSPDDTHIRFFGTKLVELAAFDPTGKQVATLYSRDLRDKVHAMLWAAVQQPAGYLCRRKVVGRTGFVDRHVSLGLPIRVPTSRVRGIINCTHTLFEPHGLIDADADIVQEMALERWVDIGAGVPG